MDGQPSSLANCTDDHLHRVESPTAACIYLPCTAMALPVDCYLPIPLTALVPCFVCTVSWACSCGAIVLPAFAISEASAPAEQSIPDEGSFPEPGPVLPEKWWSYAVVLEGAHLGSRGGSNCAEPDLSKKAFMPMSSLPRSIKFPDFQISRVLQMIMVARALLMAALLFIAAGRAGRMRDI